MTRLDVADNNVADTQRASSGDVPPLQRPSRRTAVCPMSFDLGGDAGTAVATQDALAEIAEGEGQRVIEMMGKAPPGARKKIIAASTDWHF